MAETIQCSVCIEDFTKQPHRKAAKCPYCDIAVCVRCTQTYLEGTHEDAHCMGCRRGWTREVLDSVCLTTWLNGDYKKHREDVLFDRERSRLPAAQLILERHKRAKELEPLREQLTEQIKALENQLSSLRADFYIIDRNMYNLSRGREAEGQGTVEKKEDKERRVFIMPCPATGCRGFLSQAYKCGVCDVYVCPDCRDIKGAERDAPHTCNEDVKATVERLKKETRPCPECGASIFKIDGCDLMFCTACNTPFSWTTGKKITSGAIHNPHYFEYIRKTNGGIMPRTGGDIPCLANLPGAWTFEREIGRKFTINASPTYTTLYQALNTIQHIANVEVHALQNNAEHLDNSDINVRYLVNEIDQNRWKQLLQQREKRRMKRDELRTRLEAFVAACVDIYGQIVRVANEQQKFLTALPDMNLILTQRGVVTLSVSQVVREWKQLKDNAPKVVEQALTEGLTQLQNLRTIFNDSLLDISKRYKCQVIQLSDTFRREYKKFETGRVRRVKKSDKDTVGTSDADDTDTEAPRNEVVRTRPA